MVEFLGNLLFTCVGYFGPEGEVQPACIFWNRNFSFRYSEVYFATSLVELPLFSLSQCQYLSGRTTGVMRVTHDII